MALLLLLSIPVMPEAQAQPYGLPELYRLDLLPRIRSSVFVGSVSSYDRTGGNDDGFSGKYSFVAREDDGLVIADLQGPGVIYRIWTPTPTEDMVEFFFDGESQPRIRVKFRELFTGGAEPFVAPLVGYGAGGFYCYVPLPFEKSCRVLVCAQAGAVLPDQLRALSRRRAGGHVAGGAFRGISAAPTARGRAVCLLWLGSQLARHAGRQLVYDAAHELCWSPEPRRRCCRRTSRAASPDCGSLRPVPWPARTATCCCAFTGMMRSSRRCFALPAISSVTPGAGPP